MIIIRMIIRCQVCSAARFLPLGPGGVDVRGDPFAGQLAVARRERLVDPAMILRSSRSTPARLAAEASGG